MIITVVTTILVLKLLLCMNYHKYFLLVSSENKKPCMQSICKMFGSCQQDG